MSVVGLLVPLGAAALLAGLVAALHRYLPPRIAARAITASLAAVALAAVPSIWLLAVAFLAHAPLVGHGFEWCAMAAGIHESVPWYVGVPSTALAAIGMPRAWTVWRTDRRVRIDTPGPIEVVDVPDAFAVTVPGRGGRIVVSSGLRQLVSDREFDAVIAHERMHARHRHDRSLLFARIVAALLPMTKPITERLQFTLERWADEGAARSCRDRHIVATVLAKVALASPPSTSRVPMLLGIGSLGVTARVHALLGTPPRRIARPTTLALWGCIVATGALGIVQLHHLVGLVAALCRM